jgi:hypothetical protein
VANKLKKLIHIVSEFFDFKGYFKNAFKLLEVGNGDNTRESVTS